MKPPTKPNKFCEHCLSVKPVTEFRRRQQGGSARLNQCRECHNQSERQRRARKRTDESHRKMAKCLTEIKNESQSEKLELAFGIMLKRFGGIEGFIKEWLEYYERAKEKGGFTAVRLLDSMIRLGKYCDQQRPDPSEMSDEDLDHVMMQYAIRTIQKQPGLAVLAADQIGWTVIPNNPPPPEAGELGS